MGTLLLTTLVGVVFATSTASFAQGDPRADYVSCVGKGLKAGGYKLTLEMADPRTTKYPNVKTFTLAEDGSVTYMLWGQECKGECTRKKGLSLHYDVYFDFEALPGTGGGCSNASFQLNVADLPREQDGNAYTVMMEGVSNFGRHIGGLLEKVE